MARKSKRTNSGRRGILFWCLLSLVLLIGILVFSSNGTLKIISDSFQAFANPNGTDPTIPADNFDEVKVEVDTLIENMKVRFNVPSLIYDEHAASIKCLFLGCTDFENLDEGEGRAFLEALKEEVDLLRQRISIDTATIECGYRYVLDEKAIRAIKPDPTIRPWEETDIEIRDKCHNIAVEAITERIYQYSAFENPQRSPFPYFYSPLSHDKVEITKNSDSEYVIKGTVMVVTVLGAVIEPTYTVQMEVLGRDPYTAPFKVVSTETSWQQN